jgi:hypothetical protein
LVLVPYNEDDKGKDHRIDRTHHADDIAAHFVVHLKKIKRD